MVDALTFSLISGIFVGVAAGYIGSLMILKRMALVGDAMSHVALPGLALGILYNFNPFIGAFAFLFAAAVITWYIEKTSRLSPENIIGVLFVLALALGILITPTPDLLEALFGDITKVGLLDTVLAVLISVLVLIVTRTIYRRIILSLISEDLAISARINVAQANLIYLFLVSITVAVGVKIVGTLLVGALVIVPAAASKNLSQNLVRYSGLSSFFGLISAFLGILLSAYVAVPAGPLVVLVGTLIFFVTLGANQLKIRSDTKTKIAHSQT